MKKFYLMLFMLGSLLVQANPETTIAPECTITKLTAYPGPAVGLAWNEGLISWSPTPSAILYEVEINSIGLYGNADIINSYFIPASQTSMVIDLFIHNWFGNNNGKYISFRVRALCNCEQSTWGDWSDSQCFLFGTGVVPCGSYNGRMASTAITKAGIYPNPVDATINLFDIKTEKGMTYEIVNYEGDSLKSGNLDNKMINVDEMKDGLYILLIKKGGETVNSIKFLKN
jgi:Secretion system C-terminal sorting domain